MRNFYRNTKPIISIFVAIMLAAMGLLTGCVSTNLMTKVPQAPAPEQGEASITFYRSQMMGAAIAAPIAMVGDNGELSYVGVVMSGTRVVKNLKPGHYEFVVGGEGSNVLLADLDAGNYYYAEVNPHMGLWKARFSLDPIRLEDLLDDKNLRKDILGCDIVVPNERGEQWFRDNYRSMREKFDNADGRSTLHHEDGLPNPIER